MKKIHDDFIKHFLNHKEQVADFLKAHLSKDMLEQLDLNTLTNLNSEFLAMEKRPKKIADIIYSVQLVTEKPAYVIIHLEGQSSHDQYMGVRILEQHVALFRRHLEQDKQAFPIILTFVWYHGKTKWTSPKSIAQCFADFDQYVKILKSDFVVCLPGKSKQELKKYGEASIAALILATQPTGAMTSLIGDIIPNINKACCKQEATHYMATTNQGEAKDFINELAKFDPDTANNYRTMFEQSIQKSRQEARQEGVRLGEQRGRQEGRQELSKMFAKLGVDKSIIEKALQQK